MRKIEETYGQSIEKKVVIYKKNFLSQKKRPVSQTEYYFNGNQKFSVRLQNGRFNGSSRSWYIKGGLKSKGKYIHGVQHGKWSFFFQDKANLSSQGKFRQGKKHGRWKSWWENNALKSDGIYRNGNKTGIWISWDPLGQRQEVNSCHAENDTGSFTSLHPNGVVKCSYHCRKGKPIGPYTVHSPNGNLLELGHYSDSNKKVGLWNKWHPNLKPASKTLYDNGLMVDTVMTWDSLGRVSSKGVFRKGSGELLLYDTTGRVRGKGAYVSNLRQGEHWTYFPTGSPHTRKTYRNDTILSDLQWHNSKKENRLPVLAISGKYKSGKKHGLWLWFSEKAILVESAQFKNGMRHGVSKYYSPESGRLQRTQEYHNGMPTTAVLE